jgi:hypothetical protein
MPSRLFLVLPTLVFVAFFALGADEKDNDLDRLRQKLQMLEKQGSNLTAENARLKERQEKLETDLRNVRQGREQLEKEHRDAANVLDKAKEQYREALKALDKAKDSEAAAKKVKALSLEIEALDKRTEALLKKNADLVAENRRLEAESKKIDEDYKAAVKRNEELQAEYRALLKALEDYRAGSGKPGIATNPPKDSLKGKVTAVNGETGEVTISVGKDAGLEKGHTLEVYRLKPKPAYLGILLITEVKKNEALGKMKSRRGTVQVDDEVASLIGDK